MSVAITKNTANYLTCNGTSFGGIQSAAAMSICGWFKPTTVSGSSEVWLAASRQANYDEFGFGTTSSNGIALRKDNQGSSLGAISGGNWYFFGIAKGTGEFSGSAGFAASGAGSFSFADSGQIVSLSAVDLARFVIGGSTWSQGQFGGEICCVRFWNATLSAAEMYSEMKSATPVKTASLIANWRLANDTDLTSTVNGYALTINETSNGVTTGSTEPTDISADPAHDLVQSGAIGLTGAIAVTGDISAQGQFWRVPTNAPAGTTVHVTIYSGTSPTYSILAQGTATVAGGYARIPSTTGTAGDKAFAVIHNYGDNTASTNISGGPGIATRYTGL